MRIEAVTSAVPSTSQAAPSPGGFADLLAGLSASLSKEAARQETVGAMRVAAGGVEAKAFLKGLSPTELAILQEEAHLASPIQVDALSTEGAENLVRGRERWVDLNNDGVVECGAGKVIVFPPLNAPDGVKEAWKSVSAGMSRRDAATLELQLSLPFTLPMHFGRASPEMGAVASRTYDWGHHIATAIAGHEMSKSANDKTAAMRACWERLADGLRRFQQALQERGFA